MANQEQLVILRQGVKVWNKWREENPDVNIDLHGAHLVRADLLGVNLSNANLIGADLSEALLLEADFSSTLLIESTLIETNLSGANLTWTDLTGAHLGGAKLWGANFERADFSRADLSKADFGRANLSRAKLVDAKLRGASLGRTNLTDADLSGAELVNVYLSGADLTRADLTGAQLSLANLSKARLSSAQFGSTHLGNVDLSDVLGLDEVIHRSPSTIGTDSITKSKGKISEALMRGCGLSDWEIEEVKLYNPELSNPEISKILYNVYDLRATRALQISPLFISYSHLDSEFVDKLGDALNRKGIRYWRDIHDMKAGRMEKQIDRAIKQHPTVLLILSKNSLNSDWVEHEVRMARGLEKDVGSDVLCPVALDDSWKDSLWEPRVMEQVMKYNILDFSAWRDGSKFDGIFRRLIDGLELFYKG